MDEDSVREAKAVQMPEPNLEFRCSFTNPVIELESIDKALSDMPEVTKEANISEQKQSSVEANSPSVHQDTLSSDSSSLDIPVRSGKDLLASFISKYKFNPMEANNTDSEGENPDGPSSATRKRHLTYSYELGMDLEFSPEEYSSLRHAVRRDCEALQAVFAPDRIIGLQNFVDWVQSFECDEDQLRCLLFIRECLRKFHKCYLASSDYSISSDSNSAYEESRQKKARRKRSKVQKARDKRDTLMEELMKMRDNFVAETKRKKKETISVLKKYESSMKMSEEQKLKRQLEALNAIYEATLTAVDKKEDQIRDLTEEVQRLNELVVSLSGKAKTAEENYTKALKENEEINQKYNNRIRKLRGMTMEFDQVRKEMAYDVHNERAKRRKLYTENVGMKIQVRKIAFENKNLTACYDEIAAENEKLLSKIEELTVAAKEAEATAKAAEATAIAAQATAEAAQAAAKAAEDEAKAEAKEREKMKRERERKRQIENGDLDLDLLLQMDKKFRKKEDDDEYPQSPTRKQREIELKKRNRFLPPHLRSAYGSRDTVTRFLYPSILDPT